MGYQPPKKSPRRSIHEYRKSIREKSKSKNRVRSSSERHALEETHAASEKEVWEGTLKRLHTLGSQKFGSFPFNQHFDRWISNVGAVLDEFISQPSIGIDDQFEQEIAETFSTIKRQLENRRQKEGTVTQEVKNLTDTRNRLRQINAQCSTEISVIRAQKNTQIRLLNRSINQFKKEQDRIIRLKTGFLRGISKKERELQEIRVVEELTQKQNQLELAVLDLKQAQKKCRDKYDVEKEPVMAEIKKFQKAIDTLETDGSLEERWFACEALIDAVNNFLLRKATKSKSNVG